MEETDWTIKPSQIRIWENNIDYVMFIDENGNSNFTHVLKEIINGRKILDEEKYFTVTGVIFTKKSYKKAKDCINDLKNHYWEKGIFLYNDKLQKVCLHSREIRKHAGPFHHDIINYENFINDLSSTINSLDYKIISITINIEKYIKSNYRCDIYDTAMRYLLKRYMYYILNNSKGLVMLEARGKKEDNQLLNNLKHIIFETGTKSISSNELSSKIAGIYFNPKWSDIYDDTYIGLEIADLSSYPIHKFVRNNHKDKSFEILENKFDKYPNYLNKGLKIFP